MFGPLAKTNRKFIFFQICEKWKILCFCFNLFLLQFITKAKCAIYCLRVFFLQIWHNIFTKKFSICELKMHMRIYFLFPWWMLLLFLSEKLLFALTEMVKNDPFSNYLHKLALVPHLTYKHRSQYHVFKLRLNFTLVNGFIDFSWSYSCGELGMSLGAQQFGLQKGRVALAGKLWTPSLDLQQTSFIIWN